MNSHLGLTRVPPFKSWIKRKILVLHMEAPALDVETCLKMSEIPFISLPYDEKDIKEDITTILDECFGVIITGSRKVKEKLPPLPGIILDSNLPHLGLCYGCEILGIHMGASVIECNPPIGEYSEVDITLYPSLLFKGLDIRSDEIVTMAHSYMLNEAPPGCDVIASTKKTPIAGFECPSKGIFGLQFHPEKGWLGEIIFKNFYNFCKDF